MNGKGETPRHTAYSQYLSVQLEAMELLLEAGTDVHALDFNGYSPLSLAAEKGNYKACEALISAGALIYGEPGCCMTTLMSAACHDSLQSAQVLLKSGASPNIRGNNKSETDYSYNSPSIAKLLFQTDLDGHMRNSSDQLASL